MRINSNTQQLDSAYPEPTVTTRAVLSGPDQGWYTDALYPLPNNNKANVTLNDQNHIVSSEVSGPKGEAIGSSRFDPETGKIKSLFLNNSDGSTLANNYGSNGMLSSSETTIPTANGMGLVEDDTYRPHGDSTYTTYNRSLPIHTTTIGEDGKINRTRDFDRHTGQVVKDTTDGEGGNYHVNTYDSNGTQLSSQDYNYQDQPVQNTQQGVNTSWGGDTGQSGGAGTPQSGADETAGGSNSDGSAQQLEESSSASSDTEG